MLWWQQDEKMSWFESMGFDPGAAPAAGSRAANGAGAAAANGAAAAAAKKNATRKPTPSSPAKKPAAEKRRESFEQETLQVNAQQEVCL